MAGVAGYWFCERDDRRHVLCLHNEPVFEVKKLTAGRTDSHTSNAKNMFYEKYNTIPKENQIVCKICGGGVHSGVLCPQHKGLVHHKHCKECEYFISITWQCRYRLVKKGDSNERTGNAKNRKRKM